MGEGNELPTGCFGCGGDVEPHEDGLCYRCFWDFIEERALFPVPKWWEDVAVSERYL